MKLTPSVSIKSCFMNLSHMNLKDLHARWKPRIVWSFFWKFSIFPKNFPLWRLWKEGGLVQKVHHTWKKWLVRRTLNVKAYKSSSICYREILGLSKVESFSNQNKNCTTYWPKIRLLMKNKSISTSYRILTPHSMIMVVIIKFAFNRKSILEKSNRYFGKCNLKRACSEYKYATYYLATCWKNCSTTNLAFRNGWYFFSTCTRLQGNCSSER